MLKVFESRYEMPQQQRLDVIDRSVCLTSKEYYTLISAMAMVFILLVIVIVYGAINYR